MRILLWISGLISLFYGIFVFFQLGLFTISTTVVNRLDKDVYITPYGRIRSTNIDNIPLSFNFPQISNPHNKNIRIKPCDSIVLRYDSDVCLLDGLILKFNNDLFRLDSVVYTNGQIIITKELLTKSYTDSDKIMTEMSFGDYKFIIFQILMILYGPLIIGFLIIRRKK